MSNTNSKSKKSKKGLIIAVIIVLVIALMILVPAFSSGNNSNYLSTSVSKGTIETYYTFSGEVESKNTQNVMAESIIQISEIKVKEGAEVKSGDVLFVTSDGTKIKAKIDGTVNQIFVETDQQVMSGAQLCEIIDFNELEVSIKIDEYDLSCVEVDDEIDVNISAIDKEITGTVLEISRTATNQNGVSYFTAKIDLEYDSEIKVGMTAETKILNEESKDTLIIPMRALSFDEENNPYVYVADNRNGMTKVSVTVGINDGKNVEITGGLTNSEAVYYIDSNSGSGFTPQMPGM